MKNPDFTPPPSQDFQPPVQYSQTTTKNESWINVTTTKTEPDGSRTQSSFFMKRK